MSKEKSVSRSEARQLMSDFYKENKTWLPNSVKQKREFILDCIQDGMSANDAFMEAITKG